MWEFKYFFSPIPAPVCEEHKEAAENPVTVR